MRLASSIKGWQRKVVGMRFSLCGVIRSSPRKARKSERGQRPSESENKSHLGKGLRKRYTAPREKSYRKER